MLRENRVTMRTLAKNPEWLKQFIYKPFNPITVLYNIKGNELPWKDAHTRSEVETSYIHHSSRARATDDTLITLMEDTDEEVSTVDFGASLGYYIWDMFHYKWKRIWDALGADYDPIKDTAYLEISKYNAENKTIDNKKKENNRRDDEKVNDRSKNIERDKSTNATKTKDKDDSFYVEKTKTDNNAVTDDNIYGFNSADSSNSALSTSGVNEKSETSRNDLNNKVSESIEQDESKSEADRNRDYKKDFTSIDNVKENNINQEFLNDTTDKNITGLKNHTSQELIEEELELRKKTFFDMVFDDIDSVICLSIY